ncbi:MAG: hypothetical protein AAF907_16895, partial [Planctomycetota bacterium]
MPNSSITPAAVRYGWAGETEAERAYEALQNSRFALESFPTAALSASASPAASDGGVRLWDLVRRVRGSDTPNVAQQTGDCVSFGAKNAVEYLQCTEIAAGDAEDFKEVFPPFLYATGRVLAGNGRLRGRAGSLGSWQAAALKEHGVLRTDTPGVPRYSGAVADAWGDGRPVRANGESVSFRDFLTIADDHPVGAAARVRTWDETVAAVANGSPVTVASNAGFTMKTGRSGYHERRGRWPHQMCVTGICDDPAKPWAALLNSWGDAHGRLTDWTTGESWPDGTLRIRREALEGMLRSGEAYALAAFAGFPPRRIDWGGLLG